MKMEDMSLSGLDNSKGEAIAHEIYTDLVEDACLGLCFEVHRAVKCGYFFLDDTDPDSMKDFEIVDQPGVDIFGQVYNQWKNKECVCPNCSRSIAASRFAPHLEKCLGMGRNSSRIANRRIASSNNMNKSESDQEDNDDINDNDWSYGSEKKAKKRKSDKSPQQCGVISEHTKKMCTRSLRCPQHTDEQRRSVRVYLLGPSASLPEAEGSVENDSFEVAESQAIMSRLQWDGSSDISPSDSASSKASEYSGVGGTDPGHRALLGGPNWVFLMSPQHRRGWTDRQTDCGYPKPPPRVPRGRRCQAPTVTLR
ncbi:PREDICTED: ataxin-7-like protein 3 [Calidris pugnax]|uniref:ataxin-7-like protein 3 n=1 Tax=Calidris pugnax TaxID=198806 RepID=UPI00071CC8FF|nr:PREDICTED: ataxin-7-like protein 3 [Calidris pugnax]